MLMSDVPQAREGVQDVGKEKGVGNPGRGLIRVLDQDLSESSYKQL